MSKTISAGMTPLKKHSFTCGNMPSGVAWTRASKRALLGLLAQQGLGAAEARERAHAIRIAAHDGNLGAGVDERAGRATRRAAIAHNQHRGFGGPHVPAQRHQHAGGVGIGAAPLAGLAPDRIHRADTARQRIDDVQIANHLLLVRNGHAEAGDRHFVGQHEEIPELQRARPETADRRRRCAAPGRRDCARRAKSSGGRGRRSRRRLWLLW